MTITGVKSRTKEYYRLYMKHYRETNYERYREYYRAYIAEWNKANKTKIKGYHLKKAYGITLADKRRLIKSQKGRCGICQSDNPGTVRGWQVDADHSTSPPRIRGILCKNCNTALGVLRHDPALLTRAIEWLKRGN